MFKKQYRVSKTLVHLFVNVIARDRFVSATTISCVTVGFSNKILAPTTIISNNNILSDLFLDRF